MFFILVAVTTVFTKAVDFKGVSVALQFIKLCLHQIINVMKTFILKVKYPLAQRTAHVEMMLERPSKRFCLPDVPVLICVRPRIIIPNYDTLYLN